MKPPISVIVVNIIRRAEPTEMFTSMNNIHSRLFLRAFKLINITSNNITSKQKKVFKETKNLFKMENKDISKILVSKKQSHDEKSFRYLIGYNDNDVIRPLCIRLPRMMLNTSMMVKLLKRQCLSTLQIRNYYRSISKYGKKLVLY